MNPKKQIYEYIKSMHHSDGSEQDPGQVSRWRELFDGMSTGTARVVIDRQAADRLPDPYDVELKNQGRYYVARILGIQDRVLQRLLVDKQTGDVKLFS
jgi:hypothetical protein